MAKACRGYDGQEHRQQFNEEQAMTYIAGTPERQVVYAYADDIKAKDAEIARLRAALAEVREKLFGDKNPLHAIENALVPLDYALNQQDQPRPKLGTDVPNLGND